MMGELTPIQLSRRTYKGRNSFESSARLVNCYSERNVEEGKSAFSIYAINGLETFATLTGASGGVRGMLGVNDELLVVAGRQFYTVDLSGTDTLVGGIPSDGLVTMARNQNADGAQTVIVADGFWWVYQNGTLTQGADADLPPPIYVVEKDSYFVFLANDGQFTITGINAITVDALDFASAEARADGGVGLSTRGNDLIIFGTRSTEFWVNTGAAAFPFERQAYRNFGCYSAGTISEVTALLSGQMVDSVIWAATDENGAYTGIYLLNGYTAQKISEHDLDDLILADTNKAGLRGFAWSEDGHVFYTIKGTGYSYTYDTVEGFWHERKSVTYAYWRPTDHASFGDMVIFGDSVGGTLYKSLPTVYDAAGSDSVMEVHLPIIHAYPNGLVVDRFMLDVVTGVGLNSSDTHLSDPVVMLDVSHDGGQTFGDERHANLGGEAQINRRVEWWGLGDISLRGVTYRLRISAGVRRAMLGAALDVEQVPS